MSEYAPARRLRVQLPDNLISQRECVAAGTPALFAYE
jgi:hypothetical protein